jgi:hypothetical protein
LFDSAERAIDAIGGVRWMTRHGKRSRGIQA